MHKRTRNERGTDRQVCQWLRQIPGSSPIHLIGSSSRSSPLSLLHVYRSEVNPSSAKLIEMQNHATFLLVRAATSVVMPETQHSANCRTRIGSSVENCNQAYQSGCARDRGDLLEDSNETSHPRKACVTGVTTPCVARYSALPGTAAS